MHIISIRQQRVRPDLLTYSTLIKSLEIASVVYMLTECGQLKKENRHCETAKRLVEAIHTVKKLDCFVKTALPRNDDLAELFFLNLTLLDVNFLFRPNKMKCGTEQ